MNDKNIQLHFMISQKEKDIIKNRMRNLGINNMSAYLRKMAIDGYIIHLNLTDIKEMISLLRRCSNNLNQYAKQANKSSHIYENDIEDIKKQLNCIWDFANKLLTEISMVFDK